MIGCPLVPAIFAFSVGGGSLFAKYHVARALLCAGLLQNLTVVTAPRPDATGKLTSGLSGDRVAASGSFVAEVGLPRGIRVAVQVYFHRNSLHLSREGLTNLRQALRTLKELVGRSENAVLLISGFAGEHGSAEYALGLAAGRCERVRQYLLARGIPESRLGPVSRVSELAVYDEAAGVPGPRNDLVQISIVP